MAIASTDPVPAWHTVAPMQFGPVRRKSELDRSADDACRRYCVVLAASRRTDVPADERPSAFDVSEAREACKRAIGNRRRRLVSGRLYTVDRLGVVHVGEYRPKARRLSPRLIASFGLLAAC